MNEAIPRRAIEGRSEELTRLDRFLDSLTSRSSTLVLEGDAGIGKSVLWGVAVDRARERGWLTLTCHPAEFETDLVFAALGDLLGPVASLTDELPAVPRRALRAALMLEEPAGEGNDQRAVAHATLLLLSRLAEERPVLLGVDDLQWIDSESATVLQYAMRRLGDRPAGMVASMRVDHNRAPGTARDDPLTERLPVGPLGAEAISGLLRASVPVPLRRATVRQIFEMSGGNPLFALELARGQAPSQAGTEFAATIPTSLDELLRRRLARLPRRTRAGLLFVAILPEEPVATLATALATAGLEEAVLDAAIETGVVARSSRQIQFTHPLLGSTTYWSASPSARQAAHRVAGVILGDTPGGLRHRAMVTDSPDADLAAALERAAHDVAIRGAPDAAATLLADAVRLTPVDEARNRVRRGSRAAPGRVRRPSPGRRRDPRATSVLAALQPDVPPGVDRARLLHSLARAVGQLDGFRARGRPLREALDEAGDEIGLRCALERDLANTMSNYGDLRGALVHSELAAQHAAALPDVELRDDAEVGLAVSRLFLGLGPPEDLDLRGEKTVEANLTRVYRKLGVRSRSELAARGLDQT